MLPQLLGRELVRHLQQVLPATEEIILPHIPDQHLKDLHIQDLQTAVSEQHSQEPPVPIGRGPGHSQHIQDRQVAQPAGHIRVQRVKVQLQDLHHHLHTQGQVQAGATPVRAVRVLAGVTPVRAVRVLAGATPVRAVRVLAGAIQVRADQVQAEVILHQAAPVVQAQAGVTQEAVQVPADPVPAQAQAYQDLAAAEGN